MNDHNSQRSKSPTSTKSQSEEEYEIPCEGDLLVVRRMLGLVLKPFDESQRENIFTLGASLMTVVFLNCEWG